MAYLDDYAAVIDGYIHLYQASFKEEWLKHAEELTEYVLQHFADPNSPFFFFTDDTAGGAHCTQTELLDNVIPSSNSIMAHNSMPWACY